MSCNILNNRYNFSYYYRTQKAAAHYLVAIGKAGAAMRCIEGKAGPEA